MEKKCEYCEKILERKKYHTKYLSRGWQWEATSQFNKRRFCNPTCARAMEKKPLYNKTVRLVNGFHRNPIEMAVLQRDGFKCISCGYNGRLVIYTNGNFKLHPELKTDISAKETLCGTCLLYQKYLPLQGLQYAKILQLAPTHTYKQIAAIMGITYQRVGQHLKKAEARGDINLREIILQRKRDAIKIADKSHPVKRLLV